MHDKCVRATLPKNGAQTSVRFKSQEPGARSQEPGARSQEPGEQESRRAGEQESRRAGEQESGRAGERESGDLQSASKKAVRRAGPKATASGLSLFAVHLLFFPTAHCSLLTAHCSLFPLFSPPTISRHFAVPPQSSIIISSINLNSEMRTTDGTESTDDK